MLDHEQLGSAINDSRQQRLGRPKIDPSQRRTKRRPIYLNDAEDAKLREDYAAAGMTRHDYIRALINGYKPTARTVSSFDPRLLNELNAIGVNLNIALRDVLSASRRVHDWEQLRELLNDTILKVALAVDDSHVC